VAQIEKLPAGVSIVGTLFSLFIIILVADIFGLTRVSPFARAIR
jgi:hypothetical protein